MTIPPAPPNNAYDPHVPKIEWCRMCHKAINSMPIWMGELAFHSNCYPVSKSDYERLVLRVEALERSANSSWRKTDTDT